MELIPLLRGLSPSNFRLRAIVLGLGLRIKGVGDLGILWTERELTLEEEESQAVEAVVAIVDSRPPQGPDLKLLAPWIISQLAQDSSFSIPDVEDLP